MDESDPQGFVGTEPAGGEQQIGGRSATDGRHKAVDGVQRVADAETPGWDREQSVAGCVAQVSGQCDAEAAAHTCAPYSCDHGHPTGCQCLGGPVLYLVVVDVRVTQPLGSEFSDVRSRAEGGSFATDHQYSHVRVIVDLGN